MTREEIHSLSDHQLSALVAEICGWLDIKPTGRLDGQMQGCPPGTRMILGHRQPLDDYASDLNCMRSAEAKFYDQTHGGNESPYEQALIWIIVRDNQPCEPHEVNIWTATARQRAEAFVFVHQSK